MSRLPIPLGLAIAALTAVAAQAQPPEGSLPLSQVVALLEAEDGFAYVESIEWDDSGHWDVEIRSTDGREREIEIDPLTGASP